MSSVMNNDMCLGLRGLIDSLAFSSLTNEDQYYNEIICHVLSMG